MDSLYEFPEKDFPCRACPECKVLRGLKRSRVEIMQPRRVVSERGSEEGKYEVRAPHPREGRTDGRRDGAAARRLYSRLKRRKPDRPTATATAEGNGREDPRMRHGCNGRQADADEQTQTTLRGVADFQRAVLLRQSSLLEGVATD